MKNLLHLLLLGSNLCFAAADPLHAPPRQLHYTFDLHDPAHLHVTLDLPAHPPGSDLILLPSQWAGQTELYRAISNLRVTSPGATLTPTASPARWLLHTLRPGPVTLAYELSQDWSGPLRHPLEHRLLLGPGLFEFTGENALVAPVLSRDASVSVTFDFDGLPDGHSLVTSFGTGPHQQSVGHWSDVRNALFTGGDLATRTIEVDGQPVLLAMHGLWSFQPEEIAPKIRSILQTERHLWGDSAIPYYAIVLAPYGNVASGGGGSGFTHIFNLFLAPHQPFTADTASLIAHEAFHQWNPGALGSVADSAQIAWFTEGFTSFYQDTLIQRAGIIDKAEYLTRLNLTLRDYLLSPHLRATNAEIARISPSDRLGYQQPYLRGAVIALWLSSEIDRQTSGRHTLTDLMLDLRSGSSEPLTADRIFATAARFVDAPTVDRLRSFALDGLPVPIASTSLGVCVAFDLRPAWTFDLGFDSASLRPAGVVQGVQQGSNAYQAGVRDGQLLGGFSLWNGNSEREVTLTLREQDGKRERLSFLPRGQLLMVPQAEPIPGCAEPPRIPQ
ncbi:MAG: hypothetical protein NVSMB3_01750 [Acidobacteriaceae bacterium]